MNEPKPQDGPTITIGNRTYVYDPDAKPRTHAAMDRFTAWLDAVATLPVVTMKLVVVLILAAVYLPIASAMTLFRPRSEWKRIGLWTRDRLKHVRES